MFYCAYFMTPARAARQVAIGTAVMWAPAIYHFNYMSASGFVPRALVMTAVLWAMAILIARHRHMTQQAELRARAPGTDRPADRSCESPHLRRRTAAFGRAGREGRRPARRRVRRCQRPQGSQHRLRPRRRRPVDPPHRAVAAALLWRGRPGRSRGRRRVRRARGRRRRRAHENFRVRVRNRPDRAGGGG